MKILKEKDADKKYIAGKRVAVIGYGSQGKAQAECLRDSGVDILIGLRPDGKSWGRAVNDGFNVLSIPKAVASGDIVHILIPDEEQVNVLERQIFPNWSKNKVLSFSHGFTVFFGNIELPKNTDVILVAPKGPGTEVRKTYLEGFGVPGLIAVQCNFSGNALQTALAFAHCLGLTRAGVLETSFRDEACEDLFGEQAVLCGGLFYLMKAGFEVLTEAGYSPEMAYFETVHEMKLIVDIIYKGGLGKMADTISNTAEWGMYSAGSEIITPDIKRRMSKLLKNIEEGKFSDKWISEYKEGALNLALRRKELKNHSIEVTGQKIRKMFSSK
jgi:ketol-acid reductoisomerase